MASAVRKKGSSEGDAVALFTAKDARKAEKDNDQLHTEAIVESIARGLKPASSGLDAEQRLRRVRRRVEQRIKTIDFYEKPAGSRSDNLQPVQTWADREESLPSWKPAEVRDRSRPARDKKRETTSSAKRTAAAIRTPIG